MAKRVEAGDLKKCWGWDLFHLKRPLITLIEDRLQKKCNF
jgi:hypothetical protein